MALNFASQSAGSRGFFCCWIAIFATAPIQKHHEKRRVVSGTATQKSTRTTPLRRRVAEPFACFNSRMNLARMKILLVFGANPSRDTRVCPPLLSFWTHVDVQLCENGISHFRLDVSKLQGGANTIKWFYKVSCFSCLFVAKTAQYSHRKASFPLCHPAILRCFCFQVNCTTWKQNQPTFVQRASRT